MQPHPLLEVVIQSLVGRLALLPGLQKPMIYLLLTPWQLT